MVNGREERIKKKMRSSLRGKRRMSGGGGGGGGRMSVGYITNKFCSILCNMNRWTEKIRGDIGSGETSKYVFSLSE